LPFGDSGTTMMPRRSERSNSFNALACNTLLYIDGTPHLMLKH